MPEKTSLHLSQGAQDQQLGAEQDQLPCGPRGTSNGSLDIYVMHHDHTSKHPSGLWSAEEMLGGQCQRVYTPAHPRTSHNGLPQKRLEEGE